MNGGLCQVGLCVLLAVFEGLWFKWLTLHDCVSTVDGTFLVSSAQSQYTKELIEFTFDVSGSGLGSTSY